MGSHVDRMRWERRLLGLAVAAALAGAPALGLADEPAAAAAGDDEMQEQLWLMQQKLKQMEDQLDATNRRLSDAQRQLQNMPEPAAPATGLPSGVAGFLNDLEIGGWVAGSYLYNFDDPDGRDLGGFNAGTVPAFPFHPDSNSFSLDQVWLELEKPVSEDSRAGFRLDFVYGKTAGLLSGDFGAGDGLSGNDFELYQAYVQYLAPIGPGVHVQFGKFGTLIGAEVAGTRDNFNITRGHVYNLFQPITHTGILASTEPWEGGSFSLGFVNETRSFPAADIDLNKNKAVLWSVGHSLETVSFSLAGVHGDSDSGQGVDTRTGDKETIIDLIVGWEPSDRFSSYINADYIESENSNFGADDFDGYGVAVAGRYALTDRMGFALRGEWVDLDVGASPMDDLEIWGLTGTIDYSLTANLLLRAEARYDNANNSGDLEEVFFDSTGSPLGGSGVVTDEEDQIVVGAEILYTF